MEEERLVSVILPAINSCVYVLTSMHNCLFFFLLFVVCAFTKVRCRIFGTNQTDTEGKEMGDSYAVKFVFRSLFKDLDFLFQFS